jgi:hypothetical protein
MPLSIMNRIAFFRNRRDDVPNQELARELADFQDRQGIRELVQNLRNENPAVRSDCLKVLYEIGYLNAPLIAEYADDFLELLNSRNNRLVWGGMIALSTVAALRADLLFEHVSEIRRAMEKGSVITVDNGVKVLAAIASSSESRREKVFPFLLSHLAVCRPKEVPQHGESTLVAVTARNKGEFIRILKERMPEFSSSQAARVKKIIKTAEQRERPGKPDSLS